MLALRGTVAAMIACAAAAVALAGAAWGQSEGPSRGVAPISGRRSYGVPIQGRNYGLFFASDVYSDPHFPRLSNPIFDATSIAKELRAHYGFHVEVITNPTGQEVQDTLEAYARRQYGPSDQLLIYFAGHGIFSRALGYGSLIVSNSVFGNAMSYLDFPALGQTVDHIPARHILLVIDSCFSGTFNERLGEGASRGVDEYPKMPLNALLALKAPDETRKYLTSAGADFTPDGRPGHHSPFAAAFLAALRTYGGRRGYLTFDQLASDLQETKPLPYAGGWGDDAPGSDFFFLSNFAAGGVEAPRERKGPGVGVPRGPDTGPPLIAVLPFRNLSGQAGEAYLGDALADEMRSELLSGTELNLVPGQDVSRAETDFGMAPADGLGRAALAKIRGSLGADYVISGSYLAAPQTRGQVQLQIEIQDAASGTEVAATVLTGRVVALPALAARAARAARAKLGLPEALASGPVSRRALPPTNPAALRAYTEGLADMRQYRLDQAERSLANAVALEPNNAMAHEQLANAWQAMGFDARAAVEAKEALGLSASFDARDRIEIRAAYDRVDARWAGAIDSYRMLHELYPDDLSYSLLLADSQVRSGDPKMAMATLSGIGVASQRSPEVEYAEAAARDGLGDYLGEQAFARRAAEAAVAQGSKSLAARAFWRDCWALARLGRLKDAETACGHARQLAEETGAALMRARALTTLASVKAHEGDAAAALALRRQVLPIAQGIGSRRDIIGALANLANSLADSGRIAEADRRYAKAAATAREIGDYGALVNVENDEAADAEILGQYGVALALYRKSVNAAGKVGDQAAAATALGNLSALELELGEVASARKAANRALTAAQASGSGPARASALGLRGEVRLAHADLEGAAADFSHARVLLRKAGPGPAYAAALLDSARLALAQGRPAQGEAGAREALKELSKEGPDYEVEGRELLTRTLLAEGRLADAQEEIARAKVLPAKDRLVLMSLAITEAQLRARIGSPAAALQALEPVLAETANAGLVRLHLAAELAEARIELSTDPNSGRALLAAVADASSSHGLLLISQCASRIGSPARRH